MQLTPELILSLITSAAVGAAMAWLGNRIMNAEMWGHVRNHCTEINKVTALAERTSTTVVRHGQQLAVIRYRLRMDHDEPEEDV